MNRWLPRGRWVVAASAFCALFVVGTLGWVLCDVIYHGVPQWSWEYFTTNPQHAGREGGIAPILVSTVLVLGVCLATALPIGIGCALFLSESQLAQGPGGRIVRASLDATAAVPSIVFGLFGNAFFSHFLGMGFSLWAGGLTLACMVLPLLIRSSEAALRAVPADIRLGAAALGLSRTTTIHRLLLPAAAPGIAVGLVLGIGRAIAETAALLFTAGYVMRMPSGLEDSGRSLAVHIYDLAMNVPAGDVRAYAAAATLVILLLILNSLTAMLTGSSAKTEIRL
ncbi:MAG: phosphate ABC transporter permease PstA [Planctomycetota bacterium]|nr:phosphate ABC transporter permease PstA [Planctomycetota bacterium]MDA1113310.1 phosphate ABC transporter permease PstA [Planctomycetota bacterium]